MAPLEIYQQTKFSQCTRLEQNADTHRGVSVLPKLLTIPFKYPHWCSRQKATKLTNTEHLLPHQKAQFSPLRQKARTLAFHFLEAVAARQFTNLLPIAATNSAIQTSSSNQTILLSYCSATRKTRRHRLSYRYKILSSTVSSFLPFLPLSCTEFMCTFCKWMAGNSDVQHCKNRVHQYNRG